MANAELTVPSGDVATEKEGDPEDASKVPVILQIQPVSERICEDSVEAEAAVEAVEQRQEHGTVQEVEVQYGYPITCGDSKAVLLFEKFVCPGINVKCIKYNDQIISPKQFVHLAGKATLKDWKRAIRIGGVMLRKMMDSGQIDFYQHDTVCTNTCRSTKFDLLISNTRIPPQGSVLTTPTSPQGNGSQTAGVEEKLEEAAVTSVEWDPTESESKKEDEDRKEAENLPEETLNFWKGIADVGLMGEVVSNIRTELLALLRGVQLRSGQSALQPPDAAVLNSLAQMFGLLDCVKRALHDHRSHTDDNQQLVHSTLVELERQLEDQKKQARDWRSRSTPNFVFMSPGSSSKPPTPKRPRLQRPASTTVLSSSSVQQPSLTAPQFAVLSPISVGSLGQSFNIASLPVASLAQLPAGSQLITRCATAKADRFTLHPSSSLTLLRTTAGAETLQVGATASNVELVHLTQETEDGEAGVAEGQAGEPDDGTMVEGTLLMQEEVEDEGPAHATVIEIDPAPGDHAVELVGLQLAHEEGGVMLRGEMSVVAEREAEEEEAGPVVQDDVEVVAQSDEGAGVQRENQEQLQEMEIMVIEDEVHDVQVVE